MRVVVRVDASQAVGSGHFRRCLCLAGELQRRGAEVCFFSRNLPGHLLAMVVGKDMLVDALAGPTVSAASPEDGWSAAQQLADARETSRMIAAVGGCELLIVDHYGLGSEWELALRGQVQRLMVIDDLARPHLCDVLLDQNYHEHARQRYAGRLPAACQLLLGPAYALLRGEFRERRAFVTARNGPVRRLLLSLGGTDPDNRTEAILRILQEQPGREFAVDVVIGASHPARLEIESRCNAMPATRCHVQTERMAELLATADMAIGAGGGATWERCALGVPTLGVVLSSNQADVLASLATAGLVWVPDAADLDSERFAVHIRAMLGNSGLRTHLSRAGLALVDARGAERVAASLLSPAVLVRTATAADSAVILAFRNALRSRQHSRNSREIGLAEHQQWLSGVLQSADRHLLVGESRGIPLGAVRFDVTGQMAEVSINLAPAQYGKGVGTPLLLAAEQWLTANDVRVREIVAEVAAGNSSSRQLFERCGYQLAAARLTKRMVP